MSGPGDLIGYGILIGGFIYVARKIGHILPDAAGAAGSAVNNALDPVTPPSPGNGVPSGTAVDIAQGSDLPTDVHNGDQFGVYVNVNHRGPATTLWAIYSLTGILGGALAFQAQTEFQVNDDASYAPYRIGISVNVPQNIAVLVPTYGMFHIHIVDGNGNKLASQNAGGWIRP